MSANDEQPQPEAEAGYLTVEVGEFKNKRSLKRVHDIYDMVDQAFDDTYAMYAAGKIQKDGRNIRLLKAVQRYIRTVYPLLMDYSSDIEETYADEHELEASDVDANDPSGEPINEYWLGEPDADPLGWVEMEHTDWPMFDGLKDIRDADDFYPDTWTETVENRHVSNELRRHTEHRTVPAWVSEEAFDRVTLFLTEERDVIGLDFAEEEHQTRIDRELLEEVDEWRKQNVN